MSKIIFYDIPSKDNLGCWSPNTWKTRLALNFKGIGYETKWVEYPDIEPTISPHVSPNEVKGPGDSYYSFPTILFPDGTYIMESRAIIERLEKDHPTPSLNINSPFLAEVEAAIPKLAGATLGIWMPNVPDNLLNRSSAEYFYRTRAERFRRPLPQIAKDSGGEEAWMEALAPVKALGEILSRNGGPFVLGKEASYADFIIIGWLHFQKLIDEEIYTRLVKIEPRLGQLYDAAEVWMERRFD